MVNLPPEGGMNAIDVEASLAAPHRGHRIHRLGHDGHPVPTFRGRLHEAMVIPFAFAGAVAATRADGGRDTVAIAIFTASVVAMLVASAAYHCHSGSFERKLVTRRLDHAMIFVAIGGSQTAYWLLSAPAVVAVAAIVVVWVVAGLGIHHKLNHLTLTRSTGSWLYIVLGWTGVAMIPYLVWTGDAVVFASVVGGGLVYTAGGVVLLSRRLDPWPGVFGYHEIWHLTVLVGVAVHGLGVVRLSATLA